MRRMKTFSFKFELIYVIFHSKNYIKKMSFLSFGDFLNSHYLYAWKCIYITRRNKVLIILGTCSGVAVKCLTVN